MLKYVWSSQGDYYTFLAEQPIAHAKLFDINEHLMSLHTWLKDQKLKPQQRADWDLPQASTTYRLEVQRSVATETVYHFDIDHGAVQWTPNTELHPEKLTVKIVLHERPAFMFRMAFDVSDERIRFQSTPSPGWGRGEKADHNGQGSFGRNGPMSKALY